ncbi:efflux RND transporter periplasmic adaptor subunit [Bacteroides sp.]|uniref:efflux RND transporter periplasmic adaptor subunit n=1 Tax=Bacteroides sp. TaxID=29523 RepID=UPI002602C5C2|nr:efflux RND transporter periplasmic adaptor subunit [Bacteroides sp.]
MKYIGILCLVGMMCHACTSPKNEQETQEFIVSGDTITISPQSPIAQKLQISEAKKELHQMTFTVSGVVKAIPNHYAEVASPFAGRVTRSFIRLGQKVSPGSPLFEISSPDFFETGKVYYQAKQEMELASKNLRREKDLYAHKVSAQKEVEEAEVNYELKKKDYENALAALKVFQIKPDELVLGQPMIVRSPIAGEVVKNSIVIGQFIKEDAEPVAVVADLNEVWVAANVKEKDLPLLSALKQVDISLISQPNRTFSGSIYHISEMLDEETRSVEVLIACNNKERLMKPAMYATVKLTDAAAETILIPTAAILQEENQAYVLVATGDNQYRKRKVETSATDGDKSIILSGLQAGEKYISDGAFYLLNAN